MKLKLTGGFCCSILPFPLQNFSQCSSCLLGPQFSPLFLLPVSSYGDEDDDVTSSSDSEDQVLKQFEISVSRSQSFRSAAAYAGVEVSHKAQLQLGRRHKFARLSDQEEGSTEPSDCEGTPD